MNWLTQKQVEVAAKKGHKSALACSCEHWEQLSTATLDEITQHPSDAHVFTTSVFCALCRRYGNKIGHKGCPLVEWKNLPGTCCKEWHVAHGRLLELLVYKSKKNFTAWQKAAKIIRC